MEEQAEKVQVKAGGPGWRNTALVVLALLFVGAVGAWFAVEKVVAPWMEGIANAPPPDQPPDVADPVPTTDDANVFMYPLKQQLLALQAQGEIQIPPYLDIIPVLAVDIQGYTEEEVTAELEKRNPEFNTVVIMVLTSKTSDELESAEGKEKALEEIRESADARLTKGKVVRVYVDRFHLAY